MNTLQLTFIILGLGGFMSILTFAILYGISAMLGMEGYVDYRLIVAYVVVSSIILYGLSFGIFAGVQKDSCGQVKNWKQIALNALIPLGFQVSFLSLALFVPWFRNVIGDLFPAETPELSKTTTTLAYYSFWAALLGGALGGTFSGSCKVESKPLTAADFSLPLPEQNQIEAKSVRFNLPPE